MGLSIILFMSGPLASDDFYMTAKPTEVFGSSSFGGKGGSPFSGIEGLLMNYAMTDAMGSAQQNAQQKVGGVMSGIQSLVSEAFPNFSGGGGGMSTTGQLGGGFNSVNQITQPTSPAPFTPAISPSDMGFPAPKIGTMGGSGLLTPDYVPKSGFGGDPDAPKINLPPEQMMSLFSQAMGGMPMIGNQKVSAFGINPKTTPQMNMMEKDLAPTPIEGGGGIGLPPSKYPTSGFNTDFNGPKVPSFMDESGGIGLPPSFDPSSVGLGGNPVLMGPQITPDMQGNFIDAVTLDPSNPASPAYNPAMEYHDPAGLGIGNLLEEPPINLAYNTNMENSPF